MLQDKTKLVDTRWLSRGLTAMAAKAPEAASQIVRKVAFDVEARAKELAPVDTGALRNSGRTVVPGGGSTALSSFTGTHTHGPKKGESETVAFQPFTESPGPEEALVAFTADYAAAVHEDLDAEHPVGQAKYLEKAVQEKAGELLGLAAGILKGVAP